MAEIYIQLLDEGTTVFRPTQGIPMGNNTFKVLATDNYERAEEVWEFPPGSVVICDREIKGGEDVLVARRLYQD